MPDLNQKQQAMLDIFQKHVGAELAGDLETTMATMTDNPHLFNMPVLTGGIGKIGVRDFYANHLVGKFFPPDVEMIVISRTIGDEQIVEELVIRFTHTTVIEWMLPGIDPTGKKVQVAFAVIVKVTDGKIAHEHIFWDQANVLVQLGLLDSTGLPVCGAEGAQRLLETCEPVNG